MITLGMCSANLLACKERKEFMSRSLSVRLGLCLLTWTAAGPLTYAQTVVYDNTSAAAVGDWTPDGFWAFNSYTPDERTGDQVKLSSTVSPVFVTGFDLL